MPLYNPPGAAGGISGSGTTDTLPVFTGATSLGNSLFKQSGGIAIADARLKSGNDQATTSAYESGGGAIGNKIFNTPTAAGTAFLNFYSQVGIDVTAATRTALTDGGRQRIFASAGANNISGAMRGNTTEVEVNGLTGTIADVYGNYTSIINSSAASAGTLYGTAADISASGTTTGITSFLSMPSVTGGTTTTVIGASLLAPTGAGTVTTYSALRMGAPGGTPNAFYLGFTPGVMVNNQQWVGPIDIPATGEVLKVLSVSGSNPYIVSWEYGAGGGSGTVTSVALATIAGLTSSVTNSPVTTSGTLTQVLATQNANTAFMGPTSGGAATPAFRTLVTADVAELLAVTDLSTYATASGTGTQAIKCTITAPATGHVLTYSAGGDWVNQASSGSGTVTSAAMTVPSFLSVAGSPITTAGTFAVTLATQNANLHFLGPVSGSAAAPTFRAMQNADVPDFHQYIELREDFLGNLTTASFPFFAAVSGTGAAINAGGVADDGGHPGLMQMATGTTTTGRAACATNSNAIALGSGVSIYETLVRTLNLSDGTDTYTLRLGFIDAVTGESTDGCFFRYTDAVNTGKWEAVTRSNSVETGSATDTGVTAQTASYSKFRIEVNAAGTSVAFYINGSLVATNTTNIPTGTTRSTGAGNFIIKSAGTTSRTANVDYQYLRFDLTTAR